MKPEYEFALPSENPEDSHDILVDTLKNNICRVTFNKADNTERIMDCTLLEVYIPDDKMPKGIRKGVNLDVINAFDLAKGDWRSFRIDSITDFEVI